MAAAARHATEAAFATLPAVFDEWNDIDKRGGALLSRFAEEISDLQCEFPSATNAADKAFMALETVLQTMERLAATIAATAEEMRGTLAALPDTDAMREQLAWRGESRCELATADFAAFAATYSQLYGAELAAKRAALSELRFDLTNAAMAALRERWHEAAADRRQAPELRDIDCRLEAHRAVRPARGTAAAGR